MLSTNDVNILGNLLNTTFGKSGGGSVAITGTLQGDVLSLKFSTMVYFACERSMRDQVNLVAEESIARLKNKLTNLKKDFRDITDSTLKINELSSRDDLELVQATSNSPRKIACYRRFVDVQVDV